MKRILFVFMSILIFMGCKTHDHPDLILIHGEIYTLDSLKPRAEAVAIRNEKIMYVGENKIAMEMKGDDTRVIDLAGKLMTPGLIEGHGHFMGLGYSLMNLDLINTSSYEEIIKLLHERVKVTKPGDWIIGRGWHQSKWDYLPEEMYYGFPSHIELSRISPENPVILRHASGHALLANAKAMEIAGIDAETLITTGGEVIKDNRGNPTGIFVESAMGLFSGFVPENDKYSDIEAYKKAVENCLTEGITSFHDAGADKSTIDLYKEMVKENYAPIRLYVMLNGSDTKFLEQYFSIGPQIDTVDYKLTIRAVKLYMDGALGSQGAWLLEPYIDRPDHLGHAVSSIDNIKMICDKAYDYGFQICTHAIGDRANREVLDIYESVIKRKPGRKDCRFRIEHAQHLSKEDIPRFAELGVIPAMQAIHMSSDRPWAIDRLGEERIREGAYVWQKLLLSGAMIVNGTDVPVEPISPINCFYASITRKTLKALPPSGYEPDQRMTREQALRSYTIDAAYGAFEERIKGSIEIGKLADFTVYSNNIMTIPEEQILKTNVVMTIIGGEILYQKSP